MWRLGRNVVAECVGLKIAAANHTTHARKRVRAREAPSDHEFKSQLGAETNGISA